MAAAAGGEGAPAHVACFRDRTEAGQRLGLALEKYAREPVVVIALPRGGVLVGEEVAKALAAPLDIWVVRKIGMPGHEELGLGAVAEGGYTYVSHEILGATAISAEDVSRLAKRKAVEVERRTHLLRGHRPRPVLTDKVVVVVDDGIATGGTIRAVIGALRAEQPARLVLAVPIAAADTLAALAPLVDDLVCLEVPTALHAVGFWYDDFRQVSDQEVVAILRRSAAQERGGRDERRAADEPNR
jgi:putative phosphoribosyl transferase